LKPLHHTIMKSDKTESAEDEFSGLFELENQKDKIDHKAHMIMFRFLSEIEKIISGRFTRKEISKLIGTSPSYITQLFRGDKLINLITLAKFEEALDSEFDIVLRKNSLKKMTSIQFDPSDFKQERLLTLEDTNPMSVVYINPDYNQKIKLPKHQTA